MSRRRVGRATLLTVLLALPGCAGREPAAPPPDAGSATAVTGRLTVLAAASLTESFTVIGRDFEQTHPGSTVRFSFGASSTVATQVVQGAPADVLAAASPATMAVATDAGAALEPTDFASNSLQIAVPPGNPGRVTALRDFANPRLRLAVCAPQVPCGAAAATVFEAAGVAARPDTLESDVRAVLAKVTSNEVDAALVYRTDVAAAGDKVGGITFPEAPAAVNRYPLAVLRESRNPVAAHAFVDHVLSPAGQQTLRAAGFGRP